jgi:flagellar motor component MotA
MKNKRKRAKMRQLFECTIVPGIINMGIYFIVLIGYVLLGGKFSSPLQLITIVIVIGALTWRVLFLLSQNVVKKILRK